jgi:ureidoacrylate peracid hydrolase
MTIFPDTQPVPFLLPAKPAPIRVDPADTAVLVVDMQNDFGAKDGMFDRAGIDISLIEQIVPATGQVIASARQAGMKIIFLKMGFSEDLSDLGSEGSPNRTRHLQFGVGQSITAPDGRPSRILVRGTWNTDIIPQLRPWEGDIVVNKTRYSGFYRTELDAVLKMHGIQNLLVTGCTTSVCVESTIRDAMFLDYCPILLEDCTAEPIGYGLPRSNYEASLLLIGALFGWVSDSHAFLQTVEAALGEPAPAGARA